MFVLFRRKDVFLLAGALTLAGMAAYVHFSRDRERWELSPHGEPEVVVAEYPSSRACSEGAQTRGMPEYDCARVDGPFWLITSFARCLEPHLKDVAPAQAEG